MGYFFRKLDLKFQRFGYETYKICFNGGDYFYSDKNNVTNYNGTKSNWNKFIETYLTDNRIDSIFLLGDCRFFHRNAIEIANKFNIDVFVFEEGYVRPNYITIEKNGVNAFSSIPKEKQFYENIISKETRKNNFTLRFGYQKMAFQATVYYIFKVLLKFRYPFYEHHRNPSVFDEALFGIRNYFRKYKNKIIELNFEDRLNNELAKKFYFIPLQTYSDFQVRIHSDFDSIESFLKEVILSFSKNAPKDTFLLLKHHPMDRGIKNYAKLIKKLASEIGISDRVIVVSDVHLPTCLKKAIGTVTINSTVGLSSLYHGIPTLTMGRACYDIEGLTCNDMKLDDFWNDFIEPDKDLFEKFRTYLIEKTQTKGSFYSKFPDDLMDKLSFDRITDTEYDSNNSYIDEEEIIYVE